MVKTKNNYYNVLSELKKIINPEDITYSKLISIIPDVVEAVEKTKVSGEFKKNITISLIEQLIKEANIDSNDRKKCMGLLNDGIVDNCIENIIRASKKNYKVNYKSKLQKFIRHTKKSNAAKKISLRYSNERRRSKD